MVTHEIVEEGTRLICGELSVPVLVVTFEDKAYDRLKLSVDAFDEFVLLLDSFFCFLSNPELRCLLQNTIPLALHDACKGGPVTLDVRRIFVYRRFVGTWSFGHAQNAH